MSHLCTLPVQEYPSDA